MPSTGWRETLAWAAPLLAAAAGSAVLLLLAGAGGSQAATAASAGTGGATPSAPPRTRAEAEARHRERLLKCQALTVAAVRAECQRQSERTLAIERAAAPD